MYLNLEGHSIYKCIGGRFESWHIESLAGALQIFICKAKNRERCSIAMLPIFYMFLIRLENSIALPRSPSTLSLPNVKAATASSLPSSNLLK